MQGGYTSIFQSSISMGAAILVVHFFAELQVVLGAEVLFNGRRLSQPMTYRKRRGLNLTENVA